MMSRISISFLIVITAISASIPLVTRADTCLGGVLYDSNADNTGKTCTPDTTNTPPAPASVPGNGGIFSCSAPGATSVAASSAIGGTYVPVFDAAVALNTGTQTYKECVLKVLAVQQKEAASLAYVQRNIDLLTEGRNGDPIWPVRFSTDRGKALDQGFTATYQSALSTLNPAIQNDVKRSVLRSYYATTRTPQNALACPYQDLQAALDGKPKDTWDALDAFITYPSCNPYEAYIQSQNLTNAGAAAAEYEWVTRLNWGRGLYDSKNAKGDVIVPAIFLGAIGEQTVTSGFRQLENINDIGQMLGPLFAGLGSKLLSGPSSIANVQTYLDQAVEQQAGALAGSIVNTALTNLNQILAWETDYNTAQQDMASVLNDAVHDLRRAEAKCWNLIVQNVCADSTSAASSTCSGKSGEALTIATSTAFSAEVMRDGKFADLALVLKDRIDISNQNLTTINTILTDVQSTVVATRNTALQQLDTIAQSSILHTATNVSKAKDELTALEESISDTSTGLVPLAIHRWAGDDADGGTGTIAWNGDLSSDAGWCNINKKQTLDNWTTEWTK